MGWEGYIEIEIAQLISTIIVLSIRGKTRFQTKQTRNIFSCRTKNGWRRSGLVSAEDGDAVKKLLQNQEDGDQGKAAAPDPV